MIDLSEFREGAGYELFDAGYLPPAKTVNGRWRRLRRCEKRAYGWLMLSRVRHTYVVRVTGVYNWRVQDRVGVGRISGGI